MVSFLNGEFAHEREVLDLFGQLPLSDRELSIDICRAVITGDNEWYGPAVVAAVRLEHWTFLDSLLYHLRESLCSSEYL